MSPSLSICGVTFIVFSSLYFFLHFNLFGGKADPGLKSEPSWSAILVHDFLIGYRRNMACLVSSPSLARLFRPNTVYLRIRFVKIGKSFIYQTKFFHIGQLLNLGCKLFGFRRYAVTSFAAIGFPILLCAMQFSIHSASTSWLFLRSRYLRALDILNGVGYCSAGNRP